MKVIISCNVVPDGLKLNLPDDFKGEALIFGGDFIVEAKRSRKNPNWYYHHHKTCKYYWLYNEISRRGKEKLNKIEDYAFERLGDWQNSYLSPCLMIHLKEKKVYVVEEKKAIESTLNYKPMYPLVLFYKVLYEVPNIKVEIKNAS